MNEKQVKSRMSSVSMAFPPICRSNIADNISKNRPLLNLRGCVVKIEIEIGDHVIHELSAAVAASAMDLLVPRLTAHLAAVSLPAPVVLETPASTGATKTPAVISMKQVQLLTGLGRSTVWRLVSDGRFPAKVQLSNGRVGWIESQVAQWIESRQSA